MRVCSLFAGAEGIDLAFEQAGFTTVWANEFDKDACKTFRRNFPGIPLVEKDIRKVKADSIPDFDVLVGGFPCQPFSIVGRQEGFNDNRGNLFFEICRVIDAKSPPVPWPEITDAAKRELSKPRKRFSMHEQFIRTVVLPIYMMN